MTAAATRALPAHGTTDAAPVREHLRTLMAADIGWRQAAHLANVSRSTVNKVLYRQPPRRTIAAEVAAKILAVSPSQPGPPAPRPRRPKTDATGTRRRIRNLHHDGYDAARIATALGVWPDLVRAWNRFSSIEVCHAEAVAGLYRAWTGIPAEDSGSSPESAAAARALARRRRWPPAGAWDPETIDDPDAEPVKWFGLHRAADLFADSEELLAHGESIYAVADRLGVTLANLKRARERVKARERAAATAAPKPT